MSINDFLIWMYGGLGSSLVFSYFAERWERFQMLSSDQRKLYKTIGASLVAIVSYLAITYVPVDFWTLLSPYWELVLGVIAVNYGVEMFHLFDKNLAKKE